VTMTFLSWCSAMRIRPLGSGSARNTRSPWRELANEARRVADAIRALDPSIRAEEGITDTTQTELDRVVGFLEREEKFVDELIKWTPLPRKSRARNAHQIAFVDHMCDLLWQPIGRRPYLLVATLTNVTFDVPMEKGWDADKVKKCYSSRSSSK
jgi:hypothetical protein